MRLLLALLLLCLFRISSAQDAAPATDDSGRIRPIEITDPVEFPRSDVEEDLASLIQPVLPVGKVTVQADFIKTRFDRHEAVKLTIPEVALQDVHKEWTRFFKKEADGKMKTEGKTTHVTEVEIPDVSGGLMDVSLQFENNQESTFVWVAMERDSSIVPSSSLPFSEMQEAMHGKGLEEYRAYVQKEVEREEKVLQKMNSEYDGLVRDNQKMHDKVDDLNSRIVTDNNALDINTTNIAEAEKSLENLNTQLGSATEANEKTLSKEVKKAERELKSYKSNEGKLNTRLLSYEQQILDNKQSISENLNLQREKILRVREQELLVEAYKVKLESIE